MRRLVFLSTSPVRPVPSLAHLSANAHFVAMRRACTTQAPLCIRCHLVSLLACVPSRATRRACTTNALSALCPHRLQAFKSYDEAGVPRRVQCLKYVVLAYMLMESKVDPFDAQEARPYKQVSAACAAAVGVAVRGRKQEARPQAGPPRLPALRCVA